MKKMVCGLLAVLLVIGLAGCGGADSDKKYDEDFLSDFVKGLQARWDYADTNTDEEKASMEKCENIELDKIGAYIDMPFEDSVLKEKAIAYINELNNGLTVISSYGVSTFYQDYDRHNDNRKKIIVEINELYPLGFDEAHQSTFSEFLSRGTEVRANEEIEQELQRIVDGITFEETEPEYVGSPFRYFETVVENTTDASFDSFGILIELIDEDGIVVGTQYGYIQNWTPGKKSKIEFLTDTDFVSMEISLDHYY